MINIHENTLPSSAVAHRLAGDFARCGIIDNYNRPTRFECVVVGGNVCPVDDFGYVDLANPYPVVDGEIQICGWQVTFIPDNGELARVGVAA